MDAIRYSQKVVTEAPKDGEVYHSITVPEGEIWYVETAHIDTIERFDDDGDTSQVGILNAEVSDIVGEDGENVETMSDRSTDNLDLGTFPSSSVGEIGAYAYGGEKIFFQKDGDAEGTGKAVAYLSARRVA